MSIAQVLRTITRTDGGDGQLDERDAAALFGGLLDGGVDELEMGAILGALAMRALGVSELAGFCRASASRTSRLHFAPAGRSRGVAPVSIPSYSGTREHPNLMPALALLHDSGYLKRASEGHIENGAVFTKIHVSRSADFLVRYLPQLGFAEEAEAASKLVHFTGYEMDIDDIMLHNPKDRLLGCLVGTADLIGQMSDRMYLEKCREFLYPEFVWGSIARETLADGREIVRYASPEDLMLKTPGFYEYVARQRMEKKLGGADRYAEAHFDGPSLYQAEIDRNMHFLKEAIEQADLKRLRRFCYSLSRNEARVA